jgi:hemolysin III
MNSPTAKGTIKSQTCTAMGTVPEEELTTRETRRVRMSPMTARLTAVKSLASYDFSFQPSLDRNRVFAPAQLDFVERRQCVHFLGPPGTGKSASPSPSASRRVKAGKSVYFATLADVVSSTQRAGRRVALNKLPPVCRSETTRSLERSQPMYYREKFNAMAHVVGAVLAVAGAVAFVALAALGGDPWKVVSVAIYGVTLVSLYSISGLYHSLRGRPKDILRELDHQSIYVLIAGSYTPFCLGRCAAPGAGRARDRMGARGARLPAGAAPEERCANPFSADLPPDGLGGRGCADPLLHALGPAGFSWLVAGGSFYTIGIVFYALDTRLTHAHGVWHLFVLAGSANHYYAILRYVL